MKTVVRLSLLLLFVSTLGQAATRSDINAIEAAEKIRYLSQKIARDYLYLYSQPQRTDLIQTMHTMTRELGENFNMIASSTRDNTTKDLLQYLEYNKVNIEELLKKKVSKEGSLQMLDYSEILLEGADSIAREHRYAFNPEETMLMSIKKDEYLVERLGKFYMASYLGALSQTNRKKMHASELALKKGLEVIRSYHYPTALEKQKKNLFLFGEASHHFLSHSYDMFIPNIITTSSDYFEKLLTQFALYHSKSQ